MSQISLLEQQTPLPGRLRSGHTGLWLSAVLVLALVAAGASALIASQADEKSPAPPAPIAIERLANAGIPARAPLALPGFQRRGPLLTGEVKTQDGSTLRLVIDTRSHAIVGYRLLAPTLAEHAAR